MTDSDRGRMKDVFAIRGEFVARSIAGETILVPIRGKLDEMKNIFVLNRVGEFVWTALDGRTSLEEICDRIIDTFDVGRAEAEQDVLDFVDELAGAGLVVKAR